MKKYFLLLYIVFAGGFTVCQQSAAPASFNTPYNIRLFADYLFCKQDYLRASLEYERYLQLNENDTVRYKYALSLLRIEKYNSAAMQFKNVPAGSEYYKASEAGFCKSAYLNNDYNTLRVYAEKKGQGSIAKKMALLSYLIPGEKFSLNENDILDSFDESDQGMLKKFYLQKTEPAYASPFKAALLSALIPGLGKIYAGETSDGIMTALITGLFGFLAYDNLHSTHQFRGYLFSGIGLFFYASGIYGSAAQAEIYNAKVDFNFKLELNSFLELKKYFTTGEPEFCR